MTDQKLLTEKLSDFPDPVDGVPGVACYAYAGPVAEAIHDLRETVKKLVDSEGTAPIDFRVEIETAAQRLLAIETEQSTHRNRFDVIATSLDRIEKRLGQIERDDSHAMDALAERLDVIETKRVGTVEATTQVSGSPAQDVVAILNAIKGVQ